MRYELAKLIVEVFSACNPFRMIVRTGALNAAAAEDWRTCRLSRFFPADAAPGAASTFGRSR